MYCFAAELIEKGDTELANPVRYTHTINHSVFARQPAEPVAQAIDAVQLGR